MPRRHFRARAKQTSSENKSVVTRSRSDGGDEAVFGGTTFSLSIAPTFSSTSVDSFTCRGYATPAAVCSLRPLSTGLLQFASSWRVMCWPLWSTAWLMSSGDCRRVVVLEGLVCWGWRGDGKCWNPRSDSRFGAHESAYIIGVLLQYVVRFSCWFNFRYAVYSHHARWCCSRYSIFKVEGSLIHSISFINVILSIHVICYFSGKASYSS